MAGSCFYILQCATFPIFWAIDRVDFPLKDGSINRQYMGIVINYIFYWLRENAIDHRLEPIGNFFQCNRQYRTLRFQSKQMTPSIQWITFILYSKVHLSRWNSYFLPLFEQYFQLEAHRKFTLIYMKSSLKWHCVLNSIKIL